MDLILSSLPKAAIALLLLAGGALGLGVALAIVAALLATLFLILALPFLLVIGSVWLLRRLGLIQGRLPLAIALLAAVLLAIGVVAAALSWTDMRVMMRTCSPVIERQDGFYHFDCRPRRPPEEEGNEGEI